MMASNRSQAYKKPYSSKSRANKKILCYVCYTYQSSQFFSRKYCSSSLTHQICDRCVYQHIVSTLNSCLTNSVSCPEFNCRASISSSVLCDILLNYNNNDLLNNYLCEQRRWEGKSEEWIKRFTLPCPGCKVPIQKNGGCPRTVCSQCKKCFYWMQSNKSGKIHAIDENVFHLVMFLMIVVVLLVCRLFFYILK